MQMMSERPRRDDLCGSCAGSQRRDASVELSDPRVVQRMIESAAGFALRRVYAYR